MRYPVLSDSIIFSANNILQLGLARHVGLRTFTRSLENIRLRTVDCCRVSPALGKPNS